MSDQEAYKLARNGDPACIPTLLSIITRGALEILRLECNDPRESAKCEAAIKFWTAEKKMLKGN